MNIAEQLEKLQALRDKGALTEDEFLRAKAKVLGSQSIADEPLQALQRTGDALKTLRRSITDRWIGGIAGGLALATGLPSWSWRVIFVASAFLHGLGLLAYAALWIFVPATVPPERMLPFNSDSQ
jgi:phage shock protein C